MCNDTLTHRCPVRAAIRIRDRAVRLGVPPELPVAVFRNTQGISQYIDDFQVKDWTLLRQDFYGAPMLIKCTSGTHRN